MENSKADRRKKIRVFFKTTVLLEIGSAKIIVNGDSTDLSLNGIFIKTKEIFPIGTSCHLKINLLGRGNTFQLEMDGTTARIEPDGIGIMFKSIELDTYTHLKKIVMYNTTENPDTIY